MAKMLELENMQFFHDELFPLFKFDMYLCKNSGIHRLALVELLDIQPGNRLLVPKSSMPLWTHFVLEFLHF